jgi:DNA-binding PadR family transcriptional regulator
MSPVFRHGRLRLYLLKLLDEAPKHGYEMIRLLQDRFMGVYAPSPGTIYPRLARLEEEGLVTHDEVEGRKVYKITEKGRAEIQARMDDLAELEEEITESVRDIAREVKEDVRDTVRSLREEIARAARDVHREDRQQAYEQAHRAREEAYGRPGDAAWQAREEARQRTEWAREEARRLREEARDRREQERSEARRERDQAQRGQEQAQRGQEGAQRGQEGAQRGQDRAWREQDDERGWPGSEQAAESGPWEHDPHAGAHPPHEERAGEAAGARFRAGRGRTRKDWGDWSSLRDWPGWKDWPGW